LQTSTVSLRPVREASSLAARTTYSASQSDGTLTVFHHSNMSTRRQQTDNSSLFDLLETTIGILLHDIPACCTRYSGTADQVLTQYRFGSMTRECSSRGVYISRSTAYLPVKSANRSSAIVVRMDEGITKSYSSSVTTHASRRYDLPRSSVDVGRPRPSFALCCHDGLREHATKSACTYGLRNTVDSGGHHKTP